MRKNAFTLIELLAVIVILAIIALIATPIILGIIKDAKENTNKISVEMYADSIKNALLNYELKENKQTTSFEDIKEYIEYDGNVICDIIQIYEDGNVYLNGCIINNDNSRGYIYGEQHLASENVRAVTESKTAKIPEINEDGNIVVGSEFKIKVSNNIKDENGEIIEYTFFVLSNSEDGKYVNLIAEQNIDPEGKFTSEPQDQDRWYTTSSNSYDNSHGPQTAYNYLSTATSNWTNIPVIENFDYEDEGYIEGTSGYQKIITKLDNSTGKYITTIIPLSDSSVIYKNMKARLPKYSEVTSTEVGCTAGNGSCPLWMVNYLYSSNNYSTDDGKVNSIGNNYGYWLLSSLPSNSLSARKVYFTGRVDSDGTHVANNGIRPVITVLKSDLLRVMQ